MERVIKKESDLSLPVKQWLEQQMYQVYFEVPYKSHYVDVVGKSIYTGNIYASVELKLCCSKEVYYQAFINRLYFANYSYICFPWHWDRPAGFIKLQDHLNNKEGLLGMAAGIGVLAVDPYTTKITQVIAANLSNPDPNHQRCLVVDERNNISLGGTHIAKGNGPMLLCYERVMDYLKTHPGATWKEIFQNVPNHYAHHASMRSALGIDLKAKGNQ